MKAKKKSIMKARKKSIRRYKRPRKITVRRKRKRTRRAKRQRWTKRLRRTDGTNKNMKGGAVDAAQYDKVDDGHGLILELQDNIGTGGQAEVWRAFQQGGEESFAVKIFDSEVSSLKVQNEIDALGELKDVPGVPGVPGVVNIIFHGAEALRADGTKKNYRYIVMELPITPKKKPLNDLQEQIEKDDRIPFGHMTALRNALNLLIIAKNILETLQQIHTKGWVHLDLACENILYDIDRHHFKIIDFGLAQRCTEEGCPEDVTRVEGRSYSVAPEIIQREPGASYDGKKADVYAVGIILYDMAYRVQANRGGFPSNSVNNTWVDSSHPAYSTFTEPLLYPIERMKMNVPTSIRNFIELLTEVNPTIRPSAEKALEIANKGIDAHQGALAVQQAAFQGLLDYNDYPDQQILTATIKEYREGCEGGAMARDTEPEPEQQVALLPPAPEPEQQQVALPPPASEPEQQVTLPPPAVKSAGS